MRTPLEFSRAIEGGGLKSAKLVVDANVVSCMAFEGSYPLHGCHVEVQVYSASGTPLFATPPQEIDSTIWPANDATGKHQAWNTRGGRTRFQIDALRALPDLEVTRGLWGRAREILR